MKKRRHKPGLRTVWVRAPSARYPVWIAPNLLARSGHLLRRVRPGGDRVFVVSSPRVWASWGVKLNRGLRAAGWRVETLLMADRETNKRLATVEALAEALLERGADRSAFLVAFGGGVVGDVAGYVAASYMRGVDYVQVPTTLVGQIDSAIGGKTGVNLPGGKNLVGAFHQPRAVIVDPQVLVSLPEREFRAGLYELVKSAVIGARGLFRLLEINMEAVLRRESHALQAVLARSIRLKAHVVSRDETEQGLRRILNFGHTVGHALEALAGYRGLRHGEAVGWGMIAATRLAERLGCLPTLEAERIVRLVGSVGALPTLPRIRPERLYAQLFADKKKRAGELHFILPRGIGRVEVRGGLPRATVLASLRELTRRLSVQ